MIEKSLTISYNKMAVEILSTKHNKNKGESDMFNLSPAIAAIDWAFSGTVVLVGLVVVFAVLLILVAFCSITGKIFSSSKKDKKKLM